MSRVKRGVTAKKRHKKILQKAKGYYGARSKVFRVAKQAVIKAQQYSYRDRKCKKRLMRQNWILKINAAARQFGVSYSNFIYLMKKNNLLINRKILSEIIDSNFKIFEDLLKKIKDV
jgi:large subunit ribosomal protein L20